MTNTIKVKTKVAPVVVESTDVQLPLYFISGKYVKSYNMMSEDLVLTSVYYREGLDSVEVKRYDEMSDAAFRLSQDMDDALYQQIDEAVFHHHFSTVHRNIFYAVNPQLKPIV